MKARRLPAPTGTPVAAIGPTWWRTGSSTARVPRLFVIDVAPLNATERRRRDRRRAVAR